MARLATAKEIINRSAVECGILTDTDPVGSVDENFQQLTQLLNSAGQELVELHPWQTLVKQYQITTDSQTDTGTYDLPGDFSYMIDQTGWERAENVPIGGPLSAQDWTYLYGRDLVSSTIYASFRLMDNKFNIFPQPPPDGLDINFEYIGRNWVKDQNDIDYYDTIQTSADLIMYEPILAIKLLKFKFLDAKGFDSNTARIEFERMFQSRTGKDRGAMVLSAGNNGRGFPYLDTYRNTGDTGYGS